MENQPPRRGIRTHTEGWSARDVTSHSAYPSVEPASYGGQRQYRDMPGKYAPPPFDYEYDRISRSSGPLPRHPARPGESTRSRERSSPARGSSGSRKRARPTPQPTQEAPSPENTERALVLVPKEEEYHSDGAESYYVECSGSEGERQKIPRSASKAGNRENPRRRQGDSRQGSERRGRAGDRYDRPPPPRQQSYDPRYDGRDMRPPPRPAGYSMPPVARRPDFDDQRSGPEPSYRYVQGGSGHREDQRYYGAGIAAPGGRQVSYTEFDWPSRHTRSESMQSSGSSRQGRPSTQSPAARVEIFIIDDREERRSRNARYY